MRAKPRDVCVIADGHKDNAFVAVTVRIGHGRDAETRKRAGQLSRLEFRVLAR
jgi:5-carboxymethyl-2-hydroxymuconate isomerase